MKIQKNDFAKRECVSLRAASPWWVCQSRDPYLVVLAKLLMEDFDVAGGISMAHMTTFSPVVDLVNLSFTNA
jgi:hypothetical protein